MQIGQGAPQAMTKPEAIPFRPFPTLPTNPRKFLNRGESQIPGDFVGGRSIGRSPPDQF